MVTWFKDSLYWEKELAKKVVSIKFFIKKNDEDLKTFIQVIRELYVNQLLAYYNNRPGKCSVLRSLYYADDVI